MTPKQEAWKTQAERIIKNMEKRHINGYYVNSKEEALELALSMMPKGSSVANGGSTTLAEIGLLPYVKEHPDEYTFIDRKAAKNEDEVQLIHSQSMMADYFLMGTNAITLDGELVNIDGNGNRVSALCFGPKHVIIVVGMNKVAADVDSAYKRIRTLACPPNTTRLGLDTPCHLTGKCGECLTTSCICSQLLTTRMSRYPDRIHVIMIGEDLGF